MNSREKGKRGERDARDAVREHWWAPGCIRAAQAAGAYASDLLDAGNGLHVEVKRRKKIAATHFMRQAERDSKESEMPVVLMSEDGHPEWLVVFRISDTSKFIEVLSKNREVQD